MECKTCAEDKPLEDFKRDPTCNNGVRKKCIACYRRENRAYYHANKHKAEHKAKRQASNRRHDLKRHYGITPEEYDRLAAEQSYQCAVCYRRKRLVIDHCHGTKKVRGLLCGPCNRGLGLFADNPARLLSAAEYLKTRNNKHQTKQRK